MTAPPSGRQYEISHGDQHATIVEVGGGIREYCAGDRAVIDPYPRDAMCDGAHGSPLVPWPNRLADGQYRFDGVDYQVALTEPEKHNAIHGFLRWRSWGLRDRQTNRVIVGAQILPLEGYPFNLDVAVDYQLGDDGLVVATTATNHGDRPCPYGTGQHPYLAPGSGMINEATLELAAGTRIVTDPDRQLPTGTEPTDGTPFDFREPRLLGDQQIDFAFTDLARDDSGRAWVRLAGVDGRQVELWVDEHYPIIELYTGDTLSPARQRHGLGAEPMTCPPNAFQTGDGIIRLAPSQSVTTRWGVGLS